MSGCLVLSYQLRLNHNTELSLRIQQKSLDPYRDLCSETSLVPFPSSAQAYIQKDMGLEDPRHPSYTDVFPQSSSMV